MNDQFKNYKCLEAYNQVVSGFVASVQGKVISGKYVVVAKVRHSQHIKDLLEIADTDETILSTHCLDVKLGSPSHAPMLWLLPTYVSKVS